MAKSAGWYFKKGAQKIYVATMELAKAAAADLANRTGKRVAVGWDAPRARARNSSAPKSPRAGTVGRVHARANPAASSLFRILGTAPNLYVDGPGNDGRGIFNRWFATKADARAAIDRYVKRHRMRANPDPGNILDVLVMQERNQAARRAYKAATKGRRMAKHLRHRDPVAAKEAAREKTGKFRVEAANRKERFTIFRPTRAQADRVAADFEAAGYSVHVRPV